MAESKKNKGKKMVCRGTWLVRFCCRVQVPDTEKGTFPKMKHISNWQRSKSLAVLGFPKEIFPLSNSPWLLFSKFKWRLHSTQSNRFLKAQLLICSTEKPRTLFPIFQWNSKLPKLHKTACSVYKKIERRRKVRDSVGNLHLSGANYRSIK